MRIGKDDVYKHRDVSAEKWRQFKEFNHAKGLISNEAPKPDKQHRSNCGG